MLAGECWNHDVSRSLLETSDQINMSAETEASESETDLLAFSRMISREEFTPVNNKTKFSDAKWSACVLIL